MKKIFALVIMAAVAAMPALAKDRYSRTVTDLPAEAQTMLAEHFAKVGVNHIKIESHFLGSDDYDVILDNGTEIEFDSKGQWTDIDCGHNAVPASVIAEPIRAYVAKNYPNQPIVKIEKKSGNKFEIELRNGVDLIFDSTGKFLRRD